MKNKTLYGSIFSPWVRKVMIVLELKSIDYNLHEMNPFIPTDKQKILQMNPLGKVPIYQENALLFSDSSVICAYLEKTEPKESIYPINADEFAKSLWYEEYANSYLTPLIASIFFDKVVAPKLHFPVDVNYTQNTLNKLPELFTYLDQNIRDKTFLVGDVFSIADISVSTAFVNLKLVGHIVDSERWKHLARYLDDVEKIKCIHSLHAQVKNKWGLIVSE